MRSIWFVVLSAPLLVAAKTAADATWTTPMPQMAATESEILIEADRRRGFGFVYGASFVSPRTFDVDPEVAGERVMAVWWSPYSGRAATHVHAYRWMPLDAHWRHCVVHVVESLVASAEFAPHSRLVMRDGSGHVVSELRVDEAACAENAPDVRR